jgi:hypothetical protein
VKCAKYPSPPKRRNYRGKKEDWWGFGRRWRKELPPPTPNKKMTKKKTCCYWRGRTDAHCAPENWGPYLAERKGTCLANNWPGNLKMEIRREEGVKFEGIMGTEHMHKIWLCEIRYIDVDQEKSIH